MINDSGGFTLLEFVIAMFILMFGLLGMLNGVNVAMDKSVESSIRNEAVILADERIMKKRSKTFTAISTVTVNVPQQETSRYFRGIFKNYSVQEIVNLSTPNSKEIIVNVAWKYRNRRVTHSISSFVSNVAP
ncbi:MAG: prepilin-type N-terminal cleavage/methylation domain-containing protein [Desulfuromonadales bacterium]